MNTDGALKGFLRYSGAGYGGALYRDFQGTVLDAFCANLDIPSSVAPEVMAVIKPRLETCMY